MRKVRESLQVGGPVRMETFEQRLLLGGYAGAIGDFVWKDLNSNGLQDAGEPGVAAVHVTLLNCDTMATVATTQTDAGGLYHFDPVAPGNYKLQFEKLAGFDFTVYNIGSDDTIDSDADATGLTQCFTIETGELDYTWDAGLVATTPVSQGCPKTLGYWSNKNGQALITSADLAMLGTLNLRNADGSAFDPTTKGDLKKWLLDGKATNMACMLSVQTATMALNIQHGFVSAGDILVTNPDGTTRTVAPAALVSEADQALAGSGNVKAGNPLRPYFESLKNALDDANNNLNWV